MDRPGAFARVLILAACGLLLAASVARPPLRAARWLAPDADLAASLGFLPSECLGRPRTVEARYRVEVGRAAFRSSVLFGGQAGRAGLSCDACHRSGRDNPRFLFPGLSGAPGTADVTSDLMSPKRGDHLDNPKPIPNLSGPKDRLKISQDPARKDVEAFVHGIVTEEFDGPEPSPTVLAGLAAYVRALSPGRCPKQTLLPQRAHDRLDDVRRALLAADGALARRDPATAQAMVEAARSGLGLIYERYAAPDLERPRAELRAADLELLSLRRRIEAHAPDARVRIAEWIAGSGGLEKTLKRDESRSLFNPARLTAGA
jgi:hypothetical protein